MGNIDTFRDLVAWQRSMELAVAVYRLTRLLPKEEVYGLSAQMRRSSVSIPSNTAEGAGRRTTSDYIRFLHMAKGSANELDTQLELAARAGLLSPGQTCLARSLLNETHRLTQALINSLVRKR